MLPVHTKTSCCVCSQGCAIGDRMYTLVIDAGINKENPDHEFPIRPPEVRFVNKVSLPFVNSRGVVNISGVRSQRSNSQHTSVRVGLGFSNIRR